MRRSLLHWLAALAPLGWGGAYAEPLRVCATTPDLGDLTRQVGGEDVQVIVFSKGPEDPHYLVAKPGFIKQLSGADLLVRVGAELEVGWLPVLVQGARNPRVREGSLGDLDVSASIPLLGVPAAPVDRSHGHVHVGGNPHYLLDPVQGLRAAEAIANRLARLRPARAEAIHERLRAFRVRLGVALLGPTLGARLPVIEAAEAVRSGTGPAFLAAHGGPGELGGWLGDLAPFSGRAFVGNHEQYPYLAARFGLRGAAYLEPKPGVPPSTRHLRDLVARVREERIPVLLVAPYFDPKPVRFLQAETGLCVAPLAHQTGARPGIEDYLALCAHNVNALLTCLRAAP
jgi:ABC-type Zn uptake system ZnuABC Zn-binding protein ZnuA